MRNCFRTASQTVDPVETRFKYQTHTIVTGKTGTAPGPSYHPYGVAIDENTHQIFVANYIKDRVVIFSETGEYIYQLGVGQLYFPYGVAIHGDSVYVSCFGANTVIRFSLTNTSHVRRIGGFGSNNGQFDSPTQLSTDSIGRVFIADTDNNRICIHDPDLDGPYHWTFCLDPLNNFVLSDYRSHIIRVFSPEGNLLHTIRREEYQQAMFHQPTGVAVTPNGRFVFASGIKNYGLIICS